MNERLRRWNIYGSQYPLKVDFWSFPFFFHSYKKLFHQKQYFVLFHYYLIVTQQNFDYYYYFFIAWVPNRKFLLLFIPQNGVRYQYPLIEKWKSIVVGISLGQQQRCSICLLKWLVIFKFKIGRTSGNKKDKKCGLVLNFSTEHGAITRIGPCVTKYRQNEYLTKKSTSDF